MFRQFLSGIKRHYTRVRYFIRYRQWPASIAIARTNIRLGQVVYMNQIGEVESIDQNLVPIGLLGLVNNKPTIIAKELIRFPPLLLR